MWKPLPGTLEGNLQPCGSSPDGSHLEVFAHPATARELLELKLVALRDPVNSVRRFHVSMSPTPHYANGDVQLVLKEVA